MTGWCDGARRWLLAVLLGLTHYGIFIWFRTHDIWNVGQETSPSLIFAWTLGRLGMMLCLGLGFLSLGRLVLALHWRRVEELGVLERMLACFFVGTAVLRMAMFGLGLASAYTPGIALGLTLPLVVAFPLLFDVRRLYCEVADSLRAKALESLFVLGLCLLAAVMLGFVYFGSCQYSFDGDYLTHYGPYYESVVRNGGLAPNDVWYQYFYSKGAGLFYLSMLLTDRAGPLLISFMHLCAATALLFVVIRRVSGSPLWGLSAAVFMLGMMAWPVDGFFVKHHCEISAIILFVTVVVVGMTAARRFGNLFLTLACLSQASLMLYSLQAGAYTLIFAGCYGLNSLFRRDGGKFLRYSLVIGLGVVVACSALLLNYQLTGLYEITPFRLFLRFWNQEIFSRWVSPYLMFYLSEGSSPDLGTLGFSGMLQNIFMYGRLFRLEKFFFVKPFWLLSLPMLALGFWGWYRKANPTQAGADFFGFLLRPAVHNGERRRLDQGLSLPLPFAGAEVLVRGIASDSLADTRKNLLRYVLVPAFGMCLLVFLVFALVSQPISIFRASEFVSIYVTLFIFSVLIICHSMSSSLLGYRLLGVIVPVAFALVAFSWTVEASKGGKVTRPLKFALGMLQPNELSPAEPGLQQVYGQVRKASGENSLLVSLNLNVDFGPLFLQHPGIMTEVSYSFGNRWHEVVFNEPEDAMRACKELGINHFLVDLQAPFFGALPFSPLFSDESLRTNFRIIWQYGKRYLLTWDEERRPMSDEFLEEWAINQSRAMPTVMKSESDYGRALYEQVRYLYELNGRATQGIVRPKDLKRVEGWQ
ncbi:MAG: hypothetical protein HY916_03580 [Desulfovibrio sp.]|nr:hypothetical protein [Desulfovibrio sp.]